MPLDVAPPPSVTPTTPSCLCTESWRQRPLARHCRPSLAPWPDPLARLPKGHRKLLWTAAAAAPGGRGGRRISAGLGVKKTKDRVRWVCDDCGEDQLQWHGKCPACGEVGTLKRFIEPDFSPSSGGGGSGGGAGARAVARAGAVRPQSGAGAGVSLDVDEGRVVTSGSGSPRRGAWLDVTTAVPQRLLDIRDDYASGQDRIPLSGSTGAEINRVLGGGIKKGSMILVGGDPGVGKSTLLLQVAGMIAEGARSSSSDESDGAPSASSDESDSASSSSSDPTSASNGSDGSAGPGPVLYVSGEESVEQIRGRASRLGVTADELYLYSSTNMESILEWMMRLAPRAVVVDSIQTVYLDEAAGSAGSVGQIRECAAALLHTAKRSRCAVFVVGHVTKTGEIAGPRVLEHIVDVVLYMEGEKFQAHRLLRGVKNRYGTTDEVGVFEMVQGGLEAVLNPSELFLSSREEVAAGSAAVGAVAVMMEGTRPMLHEVQALCTSVQQGPGRRSSLGIDPNRLYLLVSVLTKQAGANLWMQDVHVNVVGGMRLQEPAADLAVAMAIFSSFHDRPLPRDVVFIGEIGLGGELRPVGQLDSRLKEAAKLGFRRCIVPKAGMKSARLADGKLDVVPCTSVKEALQVALPRDR